jgi:hypothetical protein
MPEGAFRADRSLMRAVPADERSWAPRAAGASTTSRRPVSARLRPKIPIRMTISIFLNALTVIDKGQGKRRAAIRVLLPKS